MKECIIQNPPLDIELGIERTPLKYYLVAPSDGISRNTGLIFWIVPWGMAANSEYSIEKLMPYLADKYDCLMACVNHHDVAIKAGVSDYMLPDGWFEKIRDKYGLPLFGDLHVALQTLHDNGIRKLDDRALITFILSGNEYLSWGVLPALDHISVLADILKNHNINRKKLILLGSSYGGYVATMILKFMPKTFSLAIDNSGFSEAMPQLINEYEHNTPITTQLHGIQIPAYTQTPWTFKKTSGPNIFSDSPTFFNEGHRRIRSLLEISHLHTSESELHCFHTPTDTVSPYATKVTYTTFRKAYAPTYLHTIKESNVDGRMFKDLSHGMNASMRGLFDYVATRRETLEKSSATTDFDLETKLNFDCSNAVYSIQFSSNLNFKMTMTNQG